MLRNSTFRSWAPRVLHTQAFRIVLVYVLLYAVSATALVAFTYWNAERALDAQTDQTIEAEVTGLREQYQRLGVLGLSDVITGRVAQHGSGLYLLQSPTGSVLAGNLLELPSKAKIIGRFVEFDYQRHVQGEEVTRTARGQAFFLSGGFLLLVARDVSERALSRKLFTTTLPWSVGLMLLFGLVGGGFMSHNVLRRLDTINRTSADIVAGDFSRRVPLSDAHDEFDFLAENLNRMLERTERLMKGMREVVDSVAHDLRTPLNRLRNRLEEMQRRADPDSPHLEDIDAAIAETDRLIGTFNALLLIAEADSGIMRGSMAPIDLAAVVADVAELYEPLAEEKGVSLSMAPAGMMMVEANRSLIGQALANLIDNAIKYTPAGGHVEVSAVETPSGIDLAVADSGPGIPPEDRARVLERFVRLESSRNSPGTGLGLSLVAAVARLHDAALTLGDNHPGLKATISFPRAPARKRPEIRETTSPAP
jgi:signal transduction histidine kinase